LIQYSLWGVRMAKIILTGKYEAIDLKALHGEQVLELDEAIVHHRYAQLLMEVKDGILQWLRVFLQAESKTLRPRKQRTLN